MSLRAIGECVSVEERPWAFEGRSGTTRKIIVQTSRKNMVELRVADGVPMPRDGDEVDLAVETRLNEGEGRRASMTLTALGDYATLHPKKAAEAARRAAPVLAGSSS